MKKIIVCGSDGSLMSHIIKTLGWFKTDYHIMGIDNLSRHGRRNQNLTDDDCLFMEADLTNRRVVMDLFTAYQPDVIIQGAATIYGVGGFNRFAADILGRDTAINANCLEAAATCTDVENFVFISSSMVYESVSIGLIPSHESHMYDYKGSNIHPPIPKTDYGLSKVVNERMVRAYNKQYALPYSIWRPFNIITPYETAGESLGDSHVFADFFNTILMNREHRLDIIGDGNQVRCFTWIDDVIEPIIDTLEHPTNTAMNIGNQEPITMRELAMIIREVGMEKGYLPPSFPPLEFNTSKSYPDDVKYRVPAVENIKHKLGWKAKVKVRESISRCADYLISTLPLYEDNSLGIGIREVE